VRPNKFHGLTAEERWRRCTMKQRWSDQFAAVAGAYVHLEKNQVDLDLYTYRCPHCKGWHLTKKKQKGQDPIRRL
jgi:hypothetical protein